MEYNKGRGEKERVEVRKQGDARRGHCDGNGIRKLRREAGSVQVTPSASSLG